MIIQIIIIFILNRTPRNSTRRKSSTDLLTTLPLIRRTRQSTNHESFKSYRSSKFCLNNIYNYLFYFLKP